MSKLTLGIVSFFCAANFGLSLKFFFQGQYITSMLVCGLALFLFVVGLREPTKLKITQAGLDYVRSPAFALEIGGMVAQYWVPEGYFYELLVNITAVRLLGRETIFSLTKDEERGFKRKVGLPQ